jgi:hypothetical protein
LLRIKIFRQSQISGVHIGDSSSSGVCRYEKELQLQSFRKFLDRTTELFFSGQRTEAMFLAQMHAHTGWIGFVLFPQEDIQSFHFMKWLTKKTTLLPVNVSIREYNIMQNNLIYAFFNHDFLNLSISLIGKFFYANYIIVGAIGIPIIFKKGQCFSSYDKFEF